MELGINPLADFFSESLFASYGGRGDHVKHACRGRGCVGGEVGHGLGG